MYLSHSVYLLRVNSFYFTLLQNDFSSIYSFTCIVSFDYLYVM